MNSLPAILGPMISTVDIASHDRLFSAVLGLRRVAEQRLDAAAVRATFGIEDHAARLWLYETPGTGRGVQLIAFDPPSDVVIREGGVGVASDALKMIDVFASDIDAAAARFRAHGFEPLGDAAPIELPDGSRFVELHVRGPDGVMLAAIRPINRDAADFVQVTEGLFSEIQSCSGPVTDADAVDAFYRDVLCMPLGFTYQFESEAFSRMIRAGTTTTLRARNYGRPARDVMLGVIHYGLPIEQTPSLRDRARPPHRGIIGIRVRVANVDDAVARCAAAGLSVPAPPATVQFEPRGRRRAAGVIAPHGVWHFLSADS